MNANTLTALRNFKRCCEDAPEGTYEDAKELNGVIGDAVDRLIRSVRALGLKADNADGAYRLEAAIYAWVRAANPDAPVFPVAEGFGDSMDGPARDRVLAQAASNRDFLRSLGIGG